jgi:flagellar protein FliS
MNQYAKQTQEYLKQRIQDASSEQLAAILLEGGQRYLGQAIQAMGQKDYRMQARSLSRVSEFICEMVARLNIEEGGEPARNLEKIYAWWTQELLEASGTRETRRLEFVSRQMGELRNTWETMHRRNVQHGAVEGEPAGDQLV